MTFSRLLEANYETCFAKVFLNLVISGLAFFETSSRSGRSESGQGFEIFTHDLTTRSFTSRGQEINSAHKTKQKCNECIPSIAVAVLLLSLYRSLRRYSQTFNILPPT